MAHAFQVLPIGAFEQIRRAKSVTQEDVAEGSGLSVKTISRIENGVAVQTESMKAALYYLENLPDRLPLLPAVDPDETEAVDHFRIEADFPLPPGISAQEMLVMVCRALTAVPIPMHRFTYTVGSLVTVFDMPLTSLMTFTNEYRAAVQDALKLNLSRCTLEALERLVIGIPRLHYFLPRLLAGPRSKNLGSALFSTDEAEPLTLLDSVTWIRVFQRLEFATYSSTRSADPDALEDRVSRRFMRFVFAYLDSLAAYKAQQPAISLPAFVYEYFHEGQFDHAHVLQPT